MLLWNIRANQNINNTDYVSKSSLIKKRTNTFPIWELRVRHLRPASVVIEVPHHEGHITVPGLTYSLAIITRLQHCQQLSVLLHVPSKAEEHKQGLAGYYRDWHDTRKTTSNSRDNKQLAGQQATRGTTSNPRDWHDTRKTTSNSRDNKQPAGQEATCGTTRNPRDNKQPAGLTRHRRYNKQLTEPTSKPQLVMFQGSYLLK